MALTTVDNVKAFLKITGSGQDAFITQAMNAAAAALSRIIGHDYVGTPITGERHSGRGHVIVLHREIASVQAVVEWNTTLASSAYAFAAESRSLRRVDSNGNPLSWLPGTKNISVNYTPPDTAPEDVKWAATNLAAFLFKQSDESGKARLGMAGSANAQGGTTQYVQEGLQLPAVKAMLKQRSRFVS